jgi:hypothetical protein
VVQQKRVLEWCVSHRWTVCGQGGEESESGIWMARTSRIVIRGAGFQPATPTSCRRRASAPDSSFTSPAGRLPSGLPPSPRGPGGPGPEPDK